MPSIEKIYQQLQQAIGQQNWPAASQSIEALLAQDPDNASLHYNCGLIEKKKHHIEQSLEHFQRALEIDPGHLNALFELGAAEMQLEHFDSAYRNFQRYLQQDQNDADALVNLGNIALKLARFDEALDALRKAHKIASSPLIVQSLAIAERENGNLETCRALLDELDASNPEIAAARLKILTQGSKGRFSIRVEDYLSAR